MAKELVKLGIEVVYGGGAVGLMGKLADTIIENGGKIKGIMPKFMNEVEWAHKGVSDFEFTETMHERKPNFSKALMRLLLITGNASCRGCNGEVAFSLCLFEYFPIHQDLHLDFGFLRIRLGREINEFPVFDLKRFFPASGSMGLLEGVRIIARVCDVKIAGRSAQDVGNFSFSVRRMKQLAQYLKWLYHNDCFLQI